MKRRTFLKNSSLLSAGGFLLGNQTLLANEGAVTVNDKLYTVFRNPAMQYRPYVRWWWNGNKIQKAELARELMLLKNAGIGGVEINPIAFPQRTPDMGIPSLQWLGNEWIDMLDFTLTEATKLGLTCDLLVGSGWPFGAEYLKGDEQAEIITIGVKKIEGITEFEAPLFDFLKEADPAVTSPYPQRRQEILKVFMVPDPMSSLDEVVDLSGQIPSGFIKTQIPFGRYTIYAVVKTHGFLEVINGAPGASGPVLNHYNKAAVEKYLNRMTDTIQQRIGPLKGRIRALFTDSMELEGSNWCSDMADEFKKRRGYDLVPYLPFTLYRIGGMGNSFDYKYGTSFTPEFENIVNRVRYDFDLTKTELIRERFIEPFQRWCAQTGVKARVQSYGRGYNPLEGSFNMDIPEGETWIKYGVGKEMSETDYRIGRAYTMVNKYVSSSAHLQGKRLISCEECTNTEMVFNTTLQMLKLCSDQSILSGITHSIYHGFNYSPQNAPFPGWIRYGNFMNEHNTYWPFFKYLNDYRARVSALLQQADMFTDIAVFTSVNDLWTNNGSQNEPFPSFMYPNYLSFIWESIHQNGNACDYIVDGIINNGTVKNGCLHYGPKKYHTIFLVGTESLEAETAGKLLDFVKSGGRIFCIETVPSKSLGLLNFEEREKNTRKIISELQSDKDRFITIKKPEKDYFNWYKNIQGNYNIRPYVKIANGNPFISQVRYTSGDTEILIFINSNYSQTYTVNLTPDANVFGNKYATAWNAEDGGRYNIANSKSFEITLYPADFKIFVFSKKKVNAKVLAQYPAVSNDAISIQTPWQVTFQHINGTSVTKQLEALTDIKDIPGQENFAGTAIYKNTFTNSGSAGFIDLGLVHGISQLQVNGKDAGTRWYGRHIYPVGNLLKQGDNEIIIKVTTVMGNYMASLTENRVAQIWTVKRRVPQPVQSLGLLGPVKIF